MKLRVLDNSIRLRLSQSEVDAMRAGGPVAGQVPFAAGSRFDYVLECSAEIERPEASFVGSAMTVRLPHADVVRWADSDQVSIRAEQTVDAEQILKILVEKDFACLSPRADEDESDLFAHPEAGKKTC